MSEAENIIDFPKQEEIATEAGHWYLPDGSPFYTVPRKTGKNKGEPRPVSLRHDRKILEEKGAVPSVTTVTKILHKGGLELYKLKQLFEAVTNLEVFPGESKETFFKRCLAASEHHKETRAEEGQELHGEIERLLLGKTQDERWRKHLDNIVGALAQHGISIFDGEPERSFAHPLGFGGKCDWHAKDHLFDKSPPIILDFKGKENKEKCEQAASHASGEYIMQIAAYREGLQIPTARGINVFVSCAEDASVLIYEWPEADLQRGWRKFQHLLAYWQEDHNFFGNNNKKGSSQ